MMHYFNFLVTDVALFEFTLFVIALFTVALFDVALFDVTLLNFVPFLHYTTWWSVEVLDALFNVALLNVSLFNLALPNVSLFKAALF